MLYNLHISKVVLISNLRVLVCSVMSHSASPRTVALQAPLSMGFPRQK